VGKTFTAVPGRGTMTADYLIDSGTAVIGSAKTVLAKIEEVREKTGLGIALPMFQFGILADEPARRSAERFAADVMPKLR
jgi:hypothetical protein